MLFMLVYGLSNVQEYGRPTDETTEIWILKTNILEYARLFLPENSNFLAKIQKSAKIPISESGERDHGIAAYYLFSPFLYLFHNKNAELIYAWHTYTFLIWFAGIFSVYFLLKEIYKPPVISVIGVIMFFFIPRFFAEGHYNNKDNVFLVTVLAALLFAVRSMKRMKWQDVILFSAASGFLMNGKVIGIAIWGLIGCFTVIYLVLRRKFTKENTAKILTAVLLSLAFYYLLTPASWKRPIALIRYCLDNAAHFSRWNNQILFRGNVIMPGTNGTPHSYLPIYFFITTPAYITALALLSGGTFIWRTIHTKGKNIISEDSSYFFLLMAVGFLVPFGYVLLNARNMVLYNSWRHLYFLYAFFFPCSLYCLNFVQTEKGRQFSRKMTALRIAAILFVCSFLTCTWDMISNRSHEYVYFNRIARAITDVNDYEGDFWDLSVTTALREFSKAYYDGKEPLKISVPGSAKNGFAAELLDEKCFEFVAPEEADYFVFNLSKADDRESARNYEKIFSLIYFDYETTGIYKLPAHME